MPAPQLPTAVLALCLAVLSPGPAGVRRAAAATPGPAALRVGVSDVPPFAIAHADGSWSGIAVDLWHEVADAIGRTWVLHQRPLSELLAGLADGSLDVVVGPLAITPQGEQAADFTHAYLATTLGIAVRPDTAPTWGRILAVVLSPRLVHVLLGMGLVSLLFATLVWLLEHRRNPAHFEGHPPRGLWSAIWWAASTLTTVGYGDKTPRTVPGQAVAIAGMIAGILLVSVLTATFASQITLAHLRSTVRSADDLRRVAVGAVPGSPAEAYLTARGIRTIDYPGVPEALAGLERREVDAVVSDDVILRYWAASRPGGAIDVLPIPLEPEYLAFALRSGSDLVEPINEALLRVTHADAWKRTVQSYLGSP